jgi:hypothetical protein
MSSLWSTHLTYLEGGYVASFHTYVNPHEHFVPYNVSRSRDSVVGIATSYGLDDRGVGV